LRTDKAENQHYVPKMLLRNFAPDGAPEKVYVFDKHTQKVWRKPTSIKNVAAERAFYEFDFDDKYVASAEHVVEQVESNTRPAMERVLTTGTLKTLSDEEKSWLVIFVTLQMLRGRAFREQALDMDKFLIEKIVSSGGDPNDVKNWKPFKDENELKHFSIHFMQSALPEMTSHLALKHMLLMTTPDDYPFLISDNPVTKSNQNDFGPYGNLGLAVRGIQVQMPISPTMMLAFWCPSIIEEMASGHAAVSARRQEALESLFLPSGVNVEEARTAIATCDAAIAITSEMLSAVREGEPLRCVPLNVDFYNSLQVVSAFRFVISNREDFWVPKKMMKDSPDLIRSWAMRLG